MRLCNALIDTRFELFLQCDHLEHTAEPCVIIRSQDFKYMYTSKGRSFMGPTAAMEYVIEYLGDRVEKMGYRLVEDPVAFPGPVLIAVPLPPS